MPNVQVQFVHCMETQVNLVLFKQDLLYRRMRSLANYEAANKKLEQAKSKGKAVAEVGMSGDAMLIAKALIGPMLCLCRSDQRSQFVS